MTDEPLFPGDDPMSNEEIGGLGYEITPSGAWRLVDPDARPPHRRGLCRQCEKFNAMAGGWCAGCLWFGPGDPHGIKARHHDDGGIETPELPKTLSPRELFRDRLRAHGRGED